MGAPRADRVVARGPISTAGGRAHALIKRYGRGYEVRIRLRELRVAELHGYLGFVEIAKRLGISKSQAHRDYWAFLQRQAGGPNGTGGQPWWWNKLAIERRSRRAFLAAGKPRPERRSAVALVAEEPPPEPPTPAARVLSPTPRPLLTFFQQGRER